MNAHNTTTSVPAACSCFVVGAMPFLTSGNCNAGEGATKPTRHEGAYCQMHEP